MRKRKWLLSFFIFLSACSPLITSTPRPSPQMIRITYSPVLSLWEERLHQCALEHPEIALTTQKTSVSSPDFGLTDLALYFGEPPGGIPGFAAPLAVDEIVIIAGGNVPFDKLNAEQLQAIYRDPDSAFQVWTYGEGNELRRIFDQTALQGLSLSPEVLLVPNPAAMLEVVAESPQAIGYIPKSWLPGSDVKQIPLEDLQAAFEHPILALTEKEPTGPVQAFMICLQNPGL